MKRRLDLGAKTTLINYSGGFTCFILKFYFHILIYSQEKRILDLRISVLWTCVQTLNSVEVPLTGKTASSFAYLDLGAFVSAEPLDLCPLWWRRDLFSPEMSNRVQVQAGWTASGHDGTFSLKDRVTTGWMVEQSLVSSGQDSLVRSDQRICFPKSAFGAFTLKWDFHLATLPSSLDPLERCTHSCPSGSFSLLHPGSLELLQVIKIIFASLTKCLRPWLLGFTVLVCFNPQHGCHSALGNVPRSRNVLEPLLKMSHMPPNHPVPELRNIKDDQKKLNY